MEVLEQCVPKHGFIGGVLHDRGDRVEPRFLRRTETTLAHDELVLARLVGVGAHDDRLQDAELADAVHQLGEVVGIEHAAGLLRIRNDVVRIESGEVCAGHGEEALRCCGLLDGRDRGRRRGVGVGEEHIDRPSRAVHVVAAGDQGADATSESGSLSCHLWFPSGSKRSGERSRRPPRGTTTTPVEAKS